MIVLAEVDRWQETTRRDRSSGCPATATANGHGPRNNQPTKHPDRSIEPADASVAYRLRLPPARGDFCAPGSD